MVRFYGISAAMFGEPVRLPITVLSGTNKDDIQEENRFNLDQSFNINSRHGTANAFRALFGTVSQVTKLAADSSPEKPVVVFGWPNDFNYRQVLENLQRSNLKLDAVPGFY